MCSPKLTTYEFDAKLCGQKAAKLYGILVNNPDISTLSASISGQLHPNESTGYLEEKDYRTILNVRNEVNIHPEFVIAENTDMNTINKLENLVYKCDSIDLKYISDIVKNEDMKSFAEKHFISENTLNYRIQNMLKTMDVSSKKELHDIFQQWFQ